MQYAEQMSALSNCSKLRVNLAMEQQLERHAAVAQIYLPLCFGNLSGYLQAFLCNDQLWEDIRHHLLSD